MKNLKTIKVERVSKKEGASNKGTQSVPWVKYGILSDKVWYGCFQKEYDNICDFNNINAITEGSEIMVIPFTTESNGNTYWNIKAPGLQEQVDDLREKVEFLMLDKAKEIRTDIKSKFPEAEDIPF